MQHRRIGDVQVSAIGLGGMPMSIEGRPDESADPSTIHAALDAGVTLIDTADAYHLRRRRGRPQRGADRQGARLARRRRAHVLVATKGGHLRPRDGSWTLDGSPAHLEEACEASLRRLGVEAIGLYQFHRPDPKVPYAESVGAVRDLLDEGKIRMAGISNADPAQIRLANEILGGRLVSVQNQFSPAFRSSEPELGCATSWASRSCPGARSAGSRGPAGSVRRTRPSPIAGAHGVSPQRVCLAWMLAKSPGGRPDPRLQPPGDHPRLRGRRGPGALRRGVGRAGRRLSPPVLDGVMSDYEPAENRYDRMGYRLCGRSGLELPAVSFGLWHNFGDRPASRDRSVRGAPAFDLGVTHFDLANNYGRRTARRG